MAKNLLTQMVQTKKSAKELIQELGFKKIEDEKSLRLLIEQVIKEFPKQWLQYKEGKEKVEQFLIGQIMKISKGQADPGKVKELMKKS